MRLIIRIVCMLALVLILGSTEFLYAQKTLTIFHINDTHSYVFPWGPKLNGERQNGAAARLIKRYKDLRTTAVNPMLLHGGDSFTGGMVFNRFLGRAEFELFDAMNLDAMALGNHDFDIRPFRLKNAIVQSRAKFDFLSANIRYNNDTTGLSQLVKPFVVKSVGNVRVGIFGLTTTSTVFYGESTPITFDSTIATARRMVDSLKARNVDLIVALTHLGLGEDRTIARSVSGIHVIVGGHSHTILETPLLERNPSSDSTIIVQAGSKWEHLGMLTLSIADNRVAYSYQIDRIAAPMAEDPSAQSMVQAYRDSIIAMYGDVFADKLGELQSDFPPVNPLAGDIEVPLVNLVTDAYRHAAKADVALEVASLMRQNMYKGPVSTSDLRDILSWAYDARQGLGKRLSVLTLTGSTLRLVLAAAGALSFDAFAGAVPSTLAISPSGLHYTFVSSGVLADFENVWINNEPLDENRVYTLVVNEFVADLAKRYPFLQILDRKELTIGPVEALASYLQSKGTIRLGDVQMGRIWDKSKLNPIVFNYRENDLTLRWNPQARATHYYVLRKNVGSVAPFQRAGQSPLTTAKFRDGSVGRGESYYYRLEELRDNGLTYFHPPVEYRVGPIPSTFYLTQNYPNPFNASTTLWIGVGERAHVSVRVYNILGQRVRVLVDQELERGEYSAVWNGTTEGGASVGSGVYLVEYVSPKGTEHKKVLLLR